MNDKNTTTGMKKRIALIVLGTMLLMMGLAACGDKEPQTATLKLSANPTTGYEWSFTQTPTIFDISSEYVQDATDEEMVGVGGIETFTLTPTKAGSTELNFYYKQPWDEDSLDTHLTYQVSVDKNMQITVDSMNGEMPGDASAVPEVPELVIE